MPKKTAGVKKPARKARVVKELLSPGELAAYEAEERAEQEEIVRQQRNREIANQKRLAARQALQAVDEEKRAKTPVTPAIVSAPQAETPPPAPVSAFAPPPPAQLPVQEIEPPEEAREIHVSKGSLVQPSSSPQQFENKPLPSYRKSIALIIACIFITAACIAGLYFSAGILTPILTIVMAGSGGLMGVGGQKLREIYQLRNPSPFSPPAGNKKSIALIFLGVSLMAVGIVGFIASMGLSALASAGFIAAGTSMITGAAFNIRNEKKLTAEFIQQKNQSDFKHKCTRLQHETILTREVNLDQQKQIDIVYTLFKTFGVEKGVTYQQYEDAFVVTCANKALTIQRDGSLTLKTMVDNHIKPSTPLLVDAISEIKKSLPLTKPHDEKQIDIHVLPHLTEQQQNTLWKLHKELMQHVSFAIQQQGCRVTIGKAVYTLKEDGELFDNLNPKPMNLNNLILIAKRNVLQSSREKKLTLSHQQINKLFAITRKTPDSVLENPNKKEGEPIYVARKDKKLSIDNDGNIRLFNPQQIGAGKAIKTGAAIRELRRN